MSVVVASKRLVLRGLYPATITPFAPDLSIDQEALRRHLGETAAVEGVRGLVVNAGLAEILQLTNEEKTRVIQTAKERCQRGQLVVGGIQGRSAAEAVRDGLDAKRAGADALLVLPPFDVRAYRRLSRHVDSVYRFFEVLDREVNLPMIVFQYPDTSGCAYSLDALLAIASLRNVVAIKAASGTVTRYVELWNRLHDKLSILAAVDSPPLLGMLLHGTHGALIGISVIGTLHWARLVDAVAQHDAATAQRLYNKICIPLMEAIFENQEPKSATSEVACVKEALVQMGQIPSSRVRPPAVDITEEHREAIRAALHATGLLEESFV
jgi:4-hydroxy-tetrahydrodipicolinate synthase